MKMVEMNKYFEDRGFEVERKYISDKRHYEFTISKNGCYLRDIFKYPTEPYANGKKAQREFLEKMVTDFEKDFPSCTAYPKITISERNALLEMLDCFAHDNDLIVNAVHWTDERTELYFIDKKDRKVRIQIRWGAVDSIYKTFKSITDHVTNRFVSMSDEVIQGIVDGIKNPDPKLTDEAKNIAKRVVNSFYGKLPTYSPEMWENIQKNFEKAFPDAAKVKIDDSGVLDNIVYMDTDAIEYTHHDVKVTQDLYKRRFTAMFNQKLPKIQNVIFNDPATIVFWADGTKTVVKAENEEFDPEKGLAMAISKKALGNKREYYYTFLHWLKKYEKKSDLEINIELPDFTEAAENLRKLTKAFRGKTVDKINTYNPIQRAYDALVTARDDGDKEFLIEEAIGYLGEALAD